MTWTLVSLICRNSKAVSLEPSGDHAAGTRNFPSPKSGRVSPVSKSSNEMSMSSGVRAFELNATLPPSGEKLSCEMRCWTFGASVNLSGQPRSAESL